MKHLGIFSLFALTGVLLFAQTKYGTWPLQLFNAIVASLPASPGSGSLAYATNGTSATDCTAGGGSFKVVCVYNGAGWVAVGGNGGSSSYGSAFFNITAGTITNLAVTGVISSVTYTSTGHYHVTLTGVSSATYKPLFSAGDNTNTAQFLVYPTANYLTSGFDYQVCNSNCSAFIDQALNFIVISQ